MSMMGEFKEFAMKGNVVDLAVGIVVGGAFGKIVTSFVNDIIMPPVGLLLGGVDFKDLMVVLKPAAGEVPAVAIRYGAFLNVLLDFIIVAFAIFMVVKAMNRMKRKEVKEEPKAEEAKKQKK
ncbi:MAG: large-conductance mechanosensitive channel protein MscL [Candidatus Woesearchaeota archaeon]|nr:large-conductance mechanosensitive channel protein MscL [Candidatus Woesearchaeota archaeon]